MSGTDVRWAPRSQRLALTGAAALICGGYVAGLKLAHPERLSDLFQLMVGARAFVAGHDPYAAVRATAELPFPLLYPLPAVIAVTPLVPLPMWAADAVFVAVGVALLAWTLTREQVIGPKTLALVSAPFLHSVVLGQWSPLMIGAGLVPALGFLLACKPNLGLALLAAYPTWRAAAGAGVFVVVSLVLWPEWPWEWRTAVATAPQSYSLVTFPGGLLLLLPLLRWRTPEARLLAVLGIVPQTTLAYASLPLFLVVRTWRESWIVWAGTAIALIGHNLAGPYDSQLAWVRASGLWLLYCAFLPCVAIVLLRGRGEKSTSL